MADVNVPASADFFKQLSLDYQQLKLSLQLLENFVFQALIRGRQLGDSQLLLILEQLEVFAVKTHKLWMSWKNA